MKILQVSTGYDISFNGGITNYVRSLSTALVDAGHTVIVLYSQNSNSLKKYKFETISYTPKLKPFHLNSVLNNKDICKIEKIVKEIGPDIIHVHMMLDLPLQVLTMFNKNAKLVISLHDYSFLCNRIVLIRSKTGENCINSHENKDCNNCIEKYETICNKYIKFILKNIKNTIIPNTNIPSCGHHNKFIETQQIFKNADALLAVSNRVKEIYETNGFTNRNFIVNHICNYTAEDDFRNKFKYRRHIEYGEIIKFGFIGNLGKIKGSDIFLSLIENSKHEFHIYGGITKSVLEKIERKRNVIYHGKYQHNELPSILKNIDIGLVLPIWEDNAPQVVFEFLNAGIPILATQMGGIPDFIDKTNGILFNPNSQGIHTIKKIMNSNMIYEFYNSVVNNIPGTKKASQHVKELVEVYNQIIDS